MHDHLRNHASINWSIVCSSLTVVMDSYYFALTETAIRRFFALPSSVSLLATGC